MGGLLRTRAGVSNSPGPTFMPPKLLSFRELLDTGSPVSENSPYRKLSFREFLFSAIQ